MDFDSSLFDLPFEDLASLGIDTQQQSFAPGAIDFEDFCKDFATANDFDADVTDSQTPAWSSESASDTSNMAATAATTAIKSDDFLDSIDKSVFDCLEPVDGSSDSLFGSNMGSDAQVVPDMIPSTANVPEFSMPTFTQTSHLAPTQLAAGQGLPGRPYSWMNGMDYATFGWPARARLPSDPAARQQSLERYRDKKARRFNNSTKVRYEMRKVNADKRPRIKGRFVKPEELQSYLNSTQAGSS